MGAFFSTLPLPAAWFPVAEDVLSPVSPSAAPAPEAHLSFARLLLLSAFWFATNAHWGALLLVLLPSRILTLVGEGHKGAGLGLVMGSGAVVALVLPLFVGALSDRCHHRWGRRRPFLLAGVALNLVGLAGLVVAPTLGWLIVAFIVVEAGNNLATAPYSALIPDLVPAAQRGAASGAMGVMIVLGTLTGAGVAGSLVDAAGPPALYARQIAWACAIIAAILVAGGSLTVIGVRERPLDGTAREERFVVGRFLRSLWISPRRYPDFARVFLMRLLVMTGIYTVQEFLQYYLKDVIGAPYRLFGRVLATTPEAAVTILAGAILLGSGVSTGLAGTLSDRVGRKRLIYVAGSVMIASALIFNLVRGFGAVLAGGLAFGLGYGTYLAVEWALACDVLPSREEAAKDMGVWHIAVMLPQVVAVPLAGPLLDSINRFHHGLGYPAIFCLAALYVLGGMGAVRGIGRRRVHG